MSRGMLPLFAGWALVGLSGCLHQDQDLVALMAAQEIALLPRDVHAQNILNTPRPKPAVPAPPIIAGPGDKLKLPPVLPGVDAPPIVLPPVDPKKLQDPARDKAIQALYPALPALESDIQPAPGPSGQALDLPALEQLALANNPAVRQAAADVQAACGGAVQAGLYPNPSFGLQWDSIGQAGTIGQPGAFVEQIFKTAGKLELARAAGMMNVRNAQLALRRTQFEVMSQVRRGYFEVLVARENMAISKAMALLAEEVYQLQVKMVQAGTVASFEPLQLNVFAVQARGNHLQARNRYLSAWRQLAAALGQPDLPPTQLSGHAEAVVPGYDYETLRAHMLGTHTDLGIAGNTVLKSRILLQLARVGPVPDISTHVYVQKDHTAEPNKYQAGVQVGLELPVYHLHQGSILQAQAELARANGEASRVTNDLSQRLADAYERYGNNIKLAHFSRDSILPNQVRVYRAIYQRYQLQPPQQAEINYNDIVVAQQTLAQALHNYLQILSAQWQAVVDLATLAQTDDIYQLTVPAPVSATPPPTTVAQLLDTRTWAATANAPMRLTDGPKTTHNAITQASHSVSPQISAPRATLALPTVMPVNANKR